MKGWAASGGRHKSPDRTGRYPPATRLSRHADPFSAASVTMRSGKSCIVTRRHAFNPRLQNALYHWARVTCSTLVAAARSTRLCDNTVAATRLSSARSAIGLLNVACAMLRNGAQFDLSLENQKRLLTGRKSPRPTSLPRRPPRASPIRRRIGLDGPPEPTKKLRGKGRARTPGRATRTARSRGGGDNAVSDAVPNQPHSS